MRPGETASARGRVLVVDDSELARVAVGRVLLEAGFEVSDAVDGAGALTALDRESFDVVITDLDMPGLDGLGVLAAVKERALDPEVIILTGAHAHDVEYALKALRLGAHDFIAKQASTFIQVLSAVDRGIEKKRIREANRRLLRELREMSLTDPLTGSLNRRSFEETLDLELARAHRHGFPLSVCLVDLDHFKHVNDVHGHVGGDAVLRAFVSVAGEAIRSGDRLFRYGGEEFAVILPNTCTAGAMQVAGRLIELVGSTPIACGGATVRITCSAGIAHVESGADDRRTLVARADAALYEAKKAGRDTVCAGRCLAPAGSHQVA